MDARQNINMYNKNLHNQLSKNVHLLKKDWTVLLKKKIVNQIKLSFTNSSGKKISAFIARDNVLVLGCSPQWTHRVATLIQNAFTNNKEHTEILSIEEFCALPITCRRNGNLFYIITCHNIGPSLAKFYDVSPYISSKFIFQLPGVQWKGSSIEIDKLSTDLLDVLGISQENLIDISLIASLKFEEFCILTP